MSCSSKKIFLNFAMSCLSIYLSYFCCFIMNYFFLIQWVHLAMRVLRGCSRTLKNPKSRSLVCLLHGSLPIVDRFSLRPSHLQSIKKFTRGAGGEYSPSPLTQKRMAVEIHGRRQSTRKREGSDEC